MSEISGGGELVASTQATQGFCFTNGAHQESLGQSNQIQGNAKDGGHGIPTWIAEPLAFI